MLVSFLGDSANLDASRCTVCAKRTMGSKLFWTPAMVVLDDEAQLEARFSPFGDSADLDAR
jgi:hypothetical protein